MNCNANVAFNDVFEAAELDFQRFEWSVGTLEGSCIVSQSLRY